MTEGEHAQPQHSLDDEFGLGAVRELLRLISESDITEIQIKRGKSELHIKRGSATQHSTQVLMTPSMAAGLQSQLASPLPPVAPFQQTGAEQPARPANAAAPRPAEADTPQGQPVTAPMVGTFYAAASPKDAPFVNEGDTINIGDRIGIIETMKMMNEIESEVAGRVVRILAKNGQPVEFGQPLMIVEPV